MDGSPSHPGLPMESELVKAREYRIARRPSLTASWSETILENHAEDNDSSSDDSSDTRTHLTKSSNADELHILTSPKIRNSAKSKAPDSPLPPPPLPQRPPPKLATPLPLAHRHSGPECPTEGNYEMLNDEPAIVHPASHARYHIDTTTATTGEGDIELKQVPVPAHRAGFHRAANSLPVNVPLISAPPVGDQPPIEPSAPPIPERVPTFMSFNHAKATDRRNYRRGSSASTSTSAYTSSPLAYGSDTEHGFVNKLATASEDVRKVAIQDASDNMSRKLFSDKILNFRDLGVSVIKASLEKQRSWDKAMHEGPMPGVVFRSADLGAAYEHDVKTLFSKYGIRTIIDLRSELEARASDILVKHYPASIQPTADQSIERLIQLRAAQIRKTLVEVAAHNYESAAKPWEKTGETRTSWSKRNSLKYSRSLGDPNKDSFARALAHLYDEEPDSEYLDPQTIAQQGNKSADPLLYQPPLPSNCNSNGEQMAARDTAPTAVLPMPLQYPSMAQSAIDWGSETLQALRSYWEQPLVGRNTYTHPRKVPLAPLPPPPNADTCNNSTNNNANINEPPESQPRGSSLSPASRQEQKSVKRKSSDASSNDASSSDSSDDSFYKLSDDQKSCPGMCYGLRPVDQDVIDDNLIQDTQYSTPLRANMEPLFVLPDNQNDNQDDASAQKYLGQDGVQSAVAPEAGPRVIIRNRFSGERQRYRCNVIGENYRKKCVWANAPWSTKIKAILRFATFNKAEAIRTIGREVLSPRGLAGSYEDYIDYCKEGFAAVMRIFADPCAYPILFHCQHGKDRTGIIAMLLLGILEVDDEIIATDYALSEPNLKPVRRRMELLDMGAVGLPPSFCDSPPSAMLELLRHIRRNYGSVRGYLRSAGLKEQEINTIAWCLRGNFCGIVHEKTRQAHTEARRLYLRPSAAHSDIFSKPPERNLPHQLPHPPLRSSASNDAQDEQRQLQSNC